MHKRLVIIIGAEFDLTEEELELGYQKFVTCIAHSLELGTPIIRLDSISVGENNG